MKHRVVAGSNPAVAIMKCLTCEKELEMLKDFPENPEDAGEIRMSFHYGSRHDGFGLPILGGPKSVLAYICDDCFEEKKHLCVIE